MKKWKILASFMFTAVIFLIFLRYLPSEEDSCNEAYSNVLEMEYKGIIKEKFLNPENHMLPTLVIDSGDIGFEIIDFRDKSGLFEYLEEGDSIIKIRSSPQVSVGREGADRTFTIIYDCSE